MKVRAYAVVIQKYEGLFASGASFDGSAFLAERNCAALAFLGLLI